MPQLILLDTMPPRDGDHSYWREMRESLAYLCVLQIMGRAEIHPWKNRSQELKLLNSREVNCVANINSTKKYEYGVE